MPINEIDIELASSPIITGLEILQGIVGKSAYQSYLATTSDVPPLTEVEWSAGGGGAGGDLVSGPVTSSGGVSSIADGALAYSMVSGLVDMLAMLGSAIGTNGGNIDDHVARVDNPHGVTKAQVGLSDADNTSDADKPVSTATQTALNLKLNLSEIAAGSPLGTIAVTATYADDAAALLGGLLADDLYFTGAKFKVVASVGGGGGLTHFTESVNTAAPNATVPIVQFLATNAATNADAALTPKGTGAIVAQIADNTATGGNKRGNHAVDWQRERTANTQVAAGTHNVIGGGRQNSAAGTYSTVAGGSNNAATGNQCTIGGGSSNVAASTSGTVAGGSSNAANGGYQFVGGGLSNTLSGSFTYGAISGGQSNMVNASHGFVGGGASNTVSASHGVIGGGQSNTASGAYAAVIGGHGNVAGGNYSVTSGQYATARGIAGVVAHAAWTLGVVAGDTQYATYNLCRLTTGSTITELTATAATGSASNRIVLPNNSAYCFSGIVIARSSTGDVKSWRIEGTIKRGANAAATAIVGTVLSVSDNDAGAAAWALTVDADTTNGTLRLQGTGAAATTIRWNARIETVEIAF